MSGKILVIAVADYTVILRSKLGAQTKVEFSIFSSNSYTCLNFICKIMWSCNANGKWIGSWTWFCMDAQTAHVQICIVLAYYTVVANPLIICRKIKKNPLIIYLSFHRDHCVLLLIATDHELDNEMQTRTRLTRLIIFNRDESVYA